MIPQMTVVADLTRSENEMSLKPGCALPPFCRPESVPPPAPCNLPPFVRLVQGGGGEVHRSLWQGERVFSMSAKVPSVMQNGLLSACCHLEIGRVLNLHL